MEFKRTNTNRQGKAGKAVIPKDHPSVASTNQSSSEQSSKTINISINLGKIASFRPPSSANIGSLARNKWVILATVAVLIICSGCTAYYFLTRDQPSPPAAAPLDKLEYQTVVPKDKSIQQLGGWQRVSPPDGTPVFAYEDAIDGVRISVSQQPLPDNFIEGTDAQLDALAKSFGATDEIKATGIKVYLGTSAKGPQSAILIKNGLLILIKSEKKIDNQSWAKYAESLD